MWDRDAAVKAVSEPTSQAPRGRVAGCLSSVRTYLPGIVVLGAGCLSSLGTYLPGTVAQGYRLYNKQRRNCHLGTVRQGHRLLKWCQNLPPGNCGAVVQAV